MIKIYKIIYLLQNFYFYRYKYIIMNNLITILLLVLVIIYYYDNKRETFTVYPSVKSIYAPIYASEDLAGIDESSIKPITINDYSNNLAYNPNNENSAHYLVKQSQPWSPESYDYLLNRDSQVIGHNSRY